MQRREEGASVFILHNKYGRSLIWPLKLLSRQPISIPGIFLPQNTFDIIVLALQNVYAIS